MLREDGTELFIAYLYFTHPESFLHDLFAYRRIVGMSAVTTHYEGTSRNSYKVHPDTRSKFNALLRFCFFAQHRLGSSSIKGPAFQFHLFVFIFLTFRLHSSRFFLFAQIVGIRTDFGFPVYTRTCIFLCQFRTTADLLYPFKYIGFELAMIRRIEVNPVVQGLPFFICQFHTMMSFLQ